MTLNIQIRPIGNVGEIYITKDPAFEKLKMLI